MGRISDFELFGLSDPITELPAKRPRPTLLASPYLRRAESLPEAPPMNPNPYNMDDAMQHRILTFSLSHLFNGCDARASRTTS